MGLSSSLLVFYCGCPSWSPFAYHTPRMIAYYLFVHPHLIVSDTPLHAIFGLNDRPSLMVLPLSLELLIPPFNDRLQSPFPYQFPCSSLFYFRELLPLFSLSLSHLFSQLTLRAVI